MGLPGCVMYAKSTIFDIMLPRIAAGIPVKAEDFYVLGHGAYASDVQSADSRTVLLERFKEVWNGIILMRMAMP